MNTQNRRQFIKNAASLAAAPAVSFAVQSKAKQVNLIFRADDMGMSHAANLGCLDAYQKGVVRSVEVMVPCPWFPEAAEMLADHKGLQRMENFPLATTYLRAEFNRRGRKFSFRIHQIRR